MKILCGFAQCFQIFSIPITVLRRNIYTPAPNNQVTTAHILPIRLNPLLLLHPSAAPIIIFILIIPNRTRAITFNLPRTPTLPSLQFPYGTSCTYTLHSRALPLYANVSKCGPRFRESLFCSSSRHRVAAAQRRLYVRRAALDRTFLQRAFKDGGYRARLLSGLLIYEDRAATTLLLLLLLLLTSWAFTIAGSGVSRCAYYSSVRGEIFWEIVGWCGDRLGNRLKGIFRKTGEFISRGVDFEWLYFVLCLR